MGPLLLCYHAISDGWPGDLAVGREQFASHVALLKRRGYRFATIDDAIASGPADRVAAISFDDALRSVAERARPVLDAAGAVATVYAPTDLIGAERPAAWSRVDGWLDGPHRDELVAMSWDELGGLASDGWQVGSHTLSHPRLPELDVAEIERQLAGSKRELEDRLGFECTSLAYPYGLLDDRARAAAERTGYANAVGTARCRPAGPADPYSIPRTVINRVDSERRFAVKTSATMRRVSGTRAWRGMNRARRSLGSRAVRQPT
ncbi:polysaccharide deacetylase family protein [Thermoleophilia bacterium SCSIO 60948]|nr:polysaccharide deacetylase family protein [Thermoleophilia bacterium SCSIO 60948]